MGVRVHGSSLWPAAVAVLGALAALPAGPTSTTDHRCRRHDLPRPGVPAAGGELGDAAEDRLPPTSTAPALAGQGRRRDDPTDLETAASGHMPTRPRWPLGWAPQRRARPRLRARQGGPSGRAAARRMPRRRRFTNQEQFVEAGAGDGIRWAWSLRQRFTPRWAARPGRPASRSWRAARRRPSSDDRLELRGPHRAAPFFDRTDGAVTLSSQGQGLEREAGQTPARPRHCSRGRNRDTHCLRAIARSDEDRAVRRREGPGVGRSGSQETCRHRPTTLLRGAGSGRRVPPRPRRPACSLLRGGASCFPERRRRMRRFLHSRGRAPRGAIRSLRSPFHRRSPPRSPSPPARSRAGRRRAVAVDVLDATAIEAAPDARRGRPACARSPPRDRAHRLARKAASLFTRGTTRATRWCSGTASR